MKLIKYRTMREVNRGTDAEPQIEKVLSDDMWMTLSDKNLEIVKATAYNGEYTIEDDGQPEPSAEPTQLDRVEAQATYTAMMTDTLLEG